MFGLKRAWPGGIMASVFAFLVACTYNPELGRMQMLVADESSMAQAAQATWNQIRQQVPVSNDPKYTTRLNRVAPRMIRAAGGNPAEWEYLVFDDPSLNAFALPGGRIGIHTGIMDIMQNDDQLATVVGHEIAHVEYRHAAERSSQSLLTSSVVGVTSVLLGSRCDGSGVSRRECEERTMAWAQIFGIGAMVGVTLPYSRKHELESDVGGVRYMQNAGYDTCEAIRFWTRMSAASAGQARPAEFLSTHPADTTRISALRNLVRQQGKTCPGV